MAAGHYKQGRFTPKNPEKYMGNVNNIIFRSSWELRVMMHCDSSNSIVRWASEEFHIPYRSPLDMEYHRYFPDFIVEVRQSDGSLKTMVLEIKPSFQRVRPVRRPGGYRKKYVAERATYMVNYAKWAAAESFCQKKGWEFKLLSEEDLGIKKRTKK